tara:strand:+ start:70 stop:558 length:489 start_codon:yes stop_codon:yes gene_type:complete
MTYVINNNSNTYNVQAQKASSVSSQTGSSSYQDLHTSDITYTCDSSATKVVYEYTANFVRTSSFGVGSAKLLKYNTTTNAWEDFSDSTYTSFGLATSSGYSRNNYTFKFVLDSWTGDKQLKMQWKMATGGLKAHHSEYIITTSGSQNSNYIIKPFLIVYSIK